MMYELSNENHVEDVMHTRNFREEQDYLTRCNATHKVTCSCEYCNYFLESGSYESSKFGTPLSKGHIYQF